MNVFPGHALAGVWLCCLLAAPSCLAQHVPERTPRPGEQRLNRFQFRTTHNSFERDNGLLDRVSIPTQLDFYDVWCIELDLRWHEDNNDFYIFHDCADEAGGGSLNSYLHVINLTKRRSKGVTFLYFDSGDIGPCFLYPNIVPKPNDWQDRLQTRLQAVFGDAVYTWADFAADNLQWPSPQELVRRSKHIIPIVNDSSSSYLFGLTGGESRIGFMNSGNEDNVITAADLGDRYFARWYPTGWTCALNNGGWTTAVGNNFSFPASNCSDISDSRFHLPMPTYVGGPTGRDGGRGSWLDPFWGVNGLKFAINAASANQAIKGPSMANLQLNRGTYPAPSRTTAAIRFTAADGTARLEAR